MGASATSRLLFWTFAVIKKYWLPPSLSVQILSFPGKPLLSISFLNTNCTMTALTQGNWQLHFSQSRMRQQNTIVCSFLKLEYILSSGGKCKIISKPNWTLTFMNTTKPAFLGWYWYFHPPKCKNLLTLLGSVACFLHYRKTKHFMQLWGINHYQYCKLCYVTRCG